MEKIKTFSEQTNQFWVTSERVKELDNGGICKSPNEVLLTTLWEKGKQFVNHLDKEYSLDKKFSDTLENIQNIINWKIKNPKEIKKTIEILWNIRKIPEERQILTEEIQAYLKKEYKKTWKQDIKNENTRNFIRQFWGTKENFTIENFLNLLQTKLYVKYWESTTEENRKKLKKGLKEMYKNWKEIITKKVITEILKTNHIVDIEFDENNEIIRIKDSKWWKPVESDKIQTRILDEQWKSHKIIDFLWCLIKTESDKYFPVITEQKDNKKTYTVQTTIDIIWINGEKKTRKITPRETSDWIWDTEYFMKKLNLPNPQQYTLEKEKNGKYFIKEKPWLFRGFFSKK